MRHPFHLILPKIETLNPETMEFGVFGGLELDLEYSLYTISLWESKWKKPFMESSRNLTKEEEIGLYEAMCLTPNVDKVMWGLLTIPLKEDILKYMADLMSATTINNRNQRLGRREIITTEIIYYWMSSLNIPYSCEHWHFNRLLKLIEVGFIKQTAQMGGGKKMNKRDTASMYREINERRKAMHNTKG